MRSWIALSALALGACAAETSSPAAVDHFEVVQGDGQTGAPGRTLDSLVVIRLIDDDGHPMADVDVTWSVLTGGGSIDSATGITNDSGLVSARWTVGSVPGDNSLRVLAAAGPSIDLSADALGLDGVDLAVASGAVCVLRSTGAVWCWGDGRDGVAQRFDYGPDPVLVDSGHSFQSIVAGEEHFCALTDDGAAWCWGSTSYGRIGRGDTVAAPFTPGLVVGGHQFTALSGADRGILAVDDTGGVWRWGSTREQNVETPSSVPEAVPVPGVTFTKIFAGYIHQCAIEADGTAWCRGHGDVGQTGDSVHQTDRAAFFSLPTATKFSSIAIGDHFSCGTTALGAMWCWGHPMFDPAGSLLTSWIPAQVAGTGYGAVVANYRTLLVAVGGGLKIAADDSYSPTLVGLPSAALIPFVGAENGVTRMSVRDQSACFLKGGSVMCAGEVPGYGTAATPVGIPAP